METAGVRPPASTQMATATSDKIPTASVQPQPVTVVTVNGKTNGKAKPTSITVQEGNVKPNDEKVKEGKVKPNDEKVKEGKVKPNDEKVKESNVKVSKVKVKENKWTDSSEDEQPKADGARVTVLTVLIIILKFVVLGQLLAAVGLQVQSLFNSNWGYDGYSDYGFIGKIFHSLWGYREEGDHSLFGKHKDGNWQDWKKPIIKFQCIALALGIAGTLVHVILVALNFVHPHKAVKIALLAAVVILSGGCGGLVIKTTLDFKKTRPILGFGVNALSPTTILQTFTQEGYTQAFASGATYLAAALFSIVLIVLTAVKHRRDSTKVTPIKSTQNE